MVIADMKKTRDPVIYDGGNVLRLRKDCGRNVVFYSSSSHIWFLTFQNFYEIDSFVWKQ